MEKVRVKETGEIIYVRTPGQYEYISSMYEPDYIRVDEKGNTVYFKDKTGLRRVYEYDIEEIEFIYD